MMTNVVIGNDVEKSGRRERYFKVEKLWTETCAELAYHQQEVEIMRLKKEALEPEFISLRNEFMTADTL